VTRLYRPIVALGAAGLLVLAGCGEKRETTTGAGASTQGTASGGPITISETEFKLDPSSPEVPKAGPVQFTVKNDGTIDHALEIEGPNGEIKTAAIAPGKSAKVTADLSKPGTYEMYCPIDGHKANGMKGEIKVAGGGSGGSGDNSGSGGGSSPGGY
jgi:plastocyanin